MGLPFLLLLVPSVIISSFVCSEFWYQYQDHYCLNISGPICLAVLFHILIDENSDGTDESIVIIYWASYSVLFIWPTPNIQDVITGTQSNFETSGGFGPNQVATFLGLGMFVFFTDYIGISV
jgi:hypothetical protein